MPNRRLVPLARLLSLWLLLCASLYAGLGASLRANSANAQTTALMVRPISIGDRAFNTIGAERIGGADCRADATVVFELDGVPDRRFVDLWLGQRCNEAGPRSADQRDCQWIKNVSVTATTRLSVEVGVQELSEGDCEGDDVKKLWFLVVNSSNSTEEPAAFQSIDLTLDFTPPSAPNGVRGGSGERQIPVSWDLPTGDELQGFVVYIDNDPAGGMAGDAGASGPADCPSSLIFGGMDAEDVPSSVETVRLDSSSATGTQLGPANLTGDVAAIAVTAIDQAGNESPLSSIACIYRVPTEGFWERYQREGGEVDGGCPCTALGPAHARDALPIAFALLALALRRRRP